MVRMFVQVGITFLLYLPTTLLACVLCTCTGQLGMPQTAQTETRPILNNAYLAHNIMTIHNQLDIWHGVPVYYTSVKIIKNEVGCRDDTVPKTIETRRH